MLNYICTFIFIGVGAILFLGFYFLMVKKAGGVSAFKNILKPENLKLLFAGPGSIGAALTGGKGASAALTPENNLPEVAEKLGLHYHELPKPNDEKIFHWTGYLVSGPYNDVSVEMKMTSMQKHVFNGVAYSYEKTITVKNAKEGYFRITPQQKNVGSEPTGNPAFDQNLVFEGDQSLLSDSQMKQIADFGWMNLTLKDGELLFLDTFQEHKQNSSAIPGKGALEMMGATHPIWQTNLQNPNVSADRTVWFIEFLTSIATKEVPQN